MNKFKHAGFLRVGAVLLSAVMTGTFVPQVAQAAQNGASSGQAVSTPSAQSANATPQSTPSAASTAKHGPTGRAVHYQPDRFAGRAGLYYSLVWGVDSLSVKWTEQGEILRFSYRILDPRKAKSLTDKNLQPALIDPQAGVKLVVPALEQVGFLRQIGTPEAGKVYWMAFSNKGRVVKRGDRVAVQIGQFHAINIVVD